MEQEHLKTATIAVGAAAVVVGLYFGLRPKAVEQEQFTATESACLAKLAQEFHPLLAAQWGQQTAEMQRALAAYGQNKSLSNLGATMALNDYKNRLTKVQIDILYCQQYAKCLPSKPEKATFDGCYSVFSDTLDDKQE